MHTTFNNMKIVRDRPLTMEELQKTIDLIRRERKEKLRYEKGWFEKIMNHFGWYRGCEMVVIDSDQLRDLSRSYGGKSWI